MKRALFRYLLAPAISILAIQSVEGRGVSPYLPLNLSPEIERKIERVLILGDKPVMRRPIPAAVVLDALPKACERDRELCEEVREYLKRYMEPYGVTTLKTELAYASGDSGATIPNAHGLPVGSTWQIIASAYFQPSDYFIINAGGIVYDRDATATGSYLSIGFDFAQLDIGFRDHWFSPLTDSSSLISTEAKTMPSVTLSNYTPLTPLGITYEVFAAEMSRQEGIPYFDSTTSGRPHLSGIQIGMEPVSGYALAINRLMQYGGGARDTSRFSQFWDAIYNNSNLPDNLASHSLEFGNQVASLTSSIIFPGKVPFTVHAEYGGEDGAYKVGCCRLGDTELSLGIDFPVLWRDFDVSYEVSEWQDAWYVHHLYPDGLTNDGNVIGHWFGDNRLFGDDIGGHGQMLRVGWRISSRDYLQAIYRDLANVAGWDDLKGGEPFPYSKLREFGLNYSTDWRGHAVDAQLYVGRDVFGQSFARLAGSVDLADSRNWSPSSVSDQSAEAESDTDLFIDLGANRSSVKRIFFTDANVASLSPSDTPQSDLHTGVGARRRVSEHSDIGVRIELDRVEGRDLLSLRAVDYRYRFNRALALNGFFGVGRYEYGLPAYGYYYGAGLQYMNVLPGWDLGFDMRYHDKIGRDKVLPTDPSPSIGQPRLFFDVSGMALYVSYHL